MLPLHFDSVWVNNFQNQFPKSLEHLDYAHESTSCISMSWHVSNPDMSLTETCLIKTSQWIPWWAKGMQESYWLQWCSQGSFPLSAMPSRKNPIACSLVLCFHTPLVHCPKVQSQLLSKTPKQFGIDIFSPGAYAVWYVLELLLHVIWFMVCSCPRSASPNAFSFFSVDVMFLPSPSQYQAHVFCTHFSGRSMTMQALTEALVFLGFLSKQSPFNVSPNLFK